MFQRAFCINPHCRKSLHVKRVPLTPYLIPSKDHRNSAEFCMGRTRGALR